MSDKFGRNKSTRWVKASVPTYGDEWGDEYDYDYNSENESEAEHSQPQTSEHDAYEKDQIDDDEQTATEIKPLDKSDDIDEDPNLQEHNPNLILSIDKLRTKEFVSDDSSSEDDDGPEIMEDQRESYDQDNSERTIASGEANKNLQSVSEEGGIVKSGEELPKNQTVTYSHKSALLPPTPTFSSSGRDNSKFESPNSDRSYQSDADSIQNEPSDLNIRNPNEYSHFKLEYVDTTEILKENDLVDDNELGQGKKDEVLEEVEGASDEPRQAPAPLVLSIDKKKYEDEEDSSDDDWGYNSQKDSEDEEEEEQEQEEEQQREEIDDQGKLAQSEKIHHGLNPEEQYDARKKSNSHKTDELDNLIKDLQSASFVGHKDGNTHKSDTNQGARQDELYLNMDSLQNISLPDFENNSFSHYDEEAHKGLNIQNVLPEDDDENESQPPTPIAPLSLRDEAKGHEDFISGLTGHRRSIRKPPPSSNSVATNRNELVSADYTNIADAVRGYMNDDASNKNLDLTTGEPGGERLSNVPETDDIEDKQSDTELQPISTVSSGSLSTGSFSFDPTNSNTAQQKEETVNHPKSEDNDDVSRRISTMSNNTISMGNWKPNTNNYRDQFINDNDNESHISFNPYADSNTNYNKFTKMRTISGASDDSNASSVSVPETIDAALPSIDEDPDNHDTTINDSGESLEPTKTINTSDSILKEPHYHPQVFKEEKVTPMSSKDDLPKSTGQEPQKYSSLLGTGNESDRNSDITRTKTNSSNISDKEAPWKSEKRVNSSSSTGSTLTSSRNFTPQPYNLYNWKSIMSTSQPIDRIRLLKDAHQKEANYETGLQNWLNESLKQSEDASNIHIGKMATQAYQNAAHNDIRRHASIRSKVSIVRDKVETSGLQASSLGKRFFNRGKKLMKSSNE